MIEPIAEFQAAALAHGLPITSPIPDGVIHRFHVPGERSGTLNGWYYLHLNPGGRPCGAFGAHSTQEDHWWAASGMGPLGARDRRRIEEAQRRQRERRQRDQEAARQRAERLWATSLLAGEHPYLAAKGIESHGLRVRDGILLVPVRDSGKRLRSLQCISSDGTKRFMKNGAVEGCYHAIGRHDGVLLIAEGYATGASLHAATGHAVAVAFFCGNLKPVALALRSRFPGSSITLCADNDLQTPGNPGIAKATEAAAAVGGRVVYPQSGDFNDMAVEHGLDAVRLMFGNECSNLGNKQ